MKRILLAGAFVLVAVASFWVGRQSADDLHPPTMQARADVAKAQNYAQPDTSESQISAEESAEPVEPSRAESDSPGDEELKREQLIAEHPEFFEGSNSYFSNNGNYLYGIERFAPQNGISSWGVEREGELADLVSSQDGLLQASYECRLSVCVTTGIVASRQQFQPVIKANNELQFYGQHYGVEPLPDGTLSFYIITHKQDN